MPNSWLRRAHPIPKFLGFITLVVAIFLPIGFFGQLLLWLTLVGCFFTARLSWKKFAKLGWAMVVIFAIFFFFNWLIYKEPMAIHLSDHFHLVGGGSTLQDASWGYLVVADQTGGNGTYISQLWGGQSPIVLTPQGMTYAGKTLSLAQIVSQNYIPQSAVLQAWHQFSSTEQLAMIRWTGDGNVATAEDFAWLITQQWTFNGINFQGGHVWGADYALPDQGFAYISHWYTLSPQAIAFNLYMTMKVYLLLLAGAVLTMTTPPLGLTQGISRLFTPLKWIRLPVDEVAMMVAMALAFIPLLFYESRQIIRAQANRGCDFRSVNPVTKIRALHALIIPMFTLTFNQVESRSLAMEARGYRPGARMTSYHRSQVGWLDGLFLFLTIGMLGMAIAFDVNHLVFAPFGLFEGMACTTR